MSASRSLNGRPIVRSSRSQRELRRTAAVFVAAAGIWLCRICRSAAREGSGDWTSNSAHNNPHRMAVMGIGARATSATSIRFLFIDCLLLLHSGLVREFVATENAHTQGKHQGQTTCKLHKMIERSTLADGDIRPSCLSSLTGNSKIVGEAAIFLIFSGQCRSRFPRRRSEDNQRSSQSRHQTTHEKTSSRRGTRGDEYGRTQKGAADLSWLEHTNTQ